MGIPFLYPLQNQRPIFLFVIMEGLKSRQASVTLENKILKTDTPSISIATPSDILPWTPAKQYHETHSEKWQVHKRFTRKGPGSLLVSLALISLKVDPCIWHFVVAWVFVSWLVCFGSVKDQFCGPTEPQTGSNTHLWHFKMELATAWHWKRIFHLQCLDFPMCAQIQLVKPKYTYHPYCYSVATEP